MLTHPDSRRLMRRNPNVIPLHKYPVGSRVCCNAPNGRPKQSYFRVARLLPDGGMGLQYRIRSEIDGVEIVVAESSLRPAPASALLGDVESAARALFNKAG